MEQHHLTRESTPSEGFRSIVRQAHRRVVRLAGRPVGRIEGTTLVRTARRSAHLWRTPPSWAFNVSVLNEARKMGARFVRVSDLETGQRFECALDSYFGPESFALDLGHGLQRALPLAAAAWTIIEARQPRLFELEPSRRRES